MTANDVIKRARIILKDESETFRWGETTLLLWLNDAVAYIRRLRPDSTFDEDEQVDNVEIATLDDTLVLDDGWLPNLTDYVVARAYESDVGDQRDLGLSDRFWKKFYDGVAL